MDKSCNYKRRPGSLSPFVSGWYNDCVLEFRIVAGLITLFPVLKVGSDLKLHQHSAVSSVVVEINISTQSQYAADLALL